MQSNFPQFLKCRWQLEPARASIEMFNELGLPAALLGNSRIAYANTLFEGMHQYFSVQSSGQLMMVGNDRMRKNFANALYRAQAQSVSVPVPAKPTRSAAIIRLMPSPEDGEPKCTAVYTKLIVTPVGVDTGVPPAGVIAGFFCLSPAEARVAVSLTSGMSLAESAVNQKITVETARAHLINVLRRTGTHRQSELVNLLKSIWPPATAGWHTQS